MTNTSETKPDWRFDIRCPHCDKAINLRDCEVGWRKLENTFNKLPEIGSAWARCPHCSVDTTATIDDQ
jgi:phage terminase large subunit GpA-like protein